MSYVTKASDWEVSCVASLAGGEVIAGGSFLFFFQSKSAGLLMNCRYHGAGIGGGLDLGQLAKQGGKLAKTDKLAKLLQTYPKLEKGFAVLAYGAAAFLSFSPIETETPFSMNDLHNTMGRLTFGSLAPGYGYTIMYITAMTGPFSNYFASQPAHGWGFGFGLAGMTTVGMWFNREGGQAGQAIETYERTLQTAAR